MYLLIVFRLSTAMIISQHVSEAKCETALRDFKAVNLGEYSIECIRPSITVRGVTEYVEIF